MHCSARICTIAFLDILAGRWSVHNPILIFLNRHWDICSSKTHFPLNLGTVSGVCVLDFHEFLQKFQLQVLAPCCLASGKKTCQTTTPSTQQGLSLSC